MLKDDDVRHIVRKSEDPMRAGTRMARQIADSLAGMVTDGELSHHDADIILSAMAPKARQDIDFWAAVRAKFGVGDA